MPDNPSLEGLSEETQTYIRSLRSEAARYRTERNDYQAKYADVNTKYTEAGNLLSQANTKLDQLATVESTAEENAKALATLTEQQERDRIAWGAGLTPEDSERLKGKTKEEWQADATALAARLNPGGRRPPQTLPKDPAAGNGPAGDGSEDPIRAAFASAGLL
jgi:chromosome segregation ATPase